MIFSIKRLCFTGMSFLIALALFSCGENSGLGSSVDTESPRLEIAYPPADSKIKGTFVFAGTCSDDKGISRVKVTVKNTTTLEAKEFSADVKDSLTWRVELNKPTGEKNAVTGDDVYEFLDGSYEVSATAYDKAGRDSGVTSRAFKFDNTPPVFIVSKPAAVKSDAGGAFSKYGSLFTVEGSASDSSGISGMDVTVYDENGEPVATEGELPLAYSESDVGSSVIIARYALSGSDTKTEANNRYDQIYAKGTADSDGTKKYSCTISVSDSALEFTNPGDSGTGSGNTTSVVYLNSGEFYDTYLSKKNGAGLDAEPLTTVINGTATDDSLSGRGVKDVTVAQVVEALAKYKIDTSDVAESSLAFSLNPNADPTYIISGFGLSYGADGKTPLSGTNKAVKGQPITIIVSAGLDQTPVVPSSLKVWCKKIGEDGKAPLTKSELTTAIDELVAADASSDVDGWKLLLDNSADASTNDTSVTLSTEVPDSDYIESNAYYAVVVTGYDQDETKLSQLKNYGFVGSITAVPPSVSITSPQSMGYFKSSSESDGLVFKGTATENNSGMALRSLKATITVTDESGGNAVSGDELTLQIEGDSSHTWNCVSGFSCVYNPDSKKDEWTFTPSLCDSYSKIKAESRGLMCSYSFTIEATGSGGLSTSETRLIHIDTKDPEVSITSITPFVSGEEYFGSSSQYKDCTFVNGIISVKGGIEEQNLKEVTYDIWASEDLTKTLSSEDSILAQLAEKKIGGIDGSLGKVYSINEPFDTTLITKFLLGSEDKPIQAEIVVTATDSVGNTGTYSSKQSNGGKNFVIYQETNRPKIELGNADENIGSADKVNINSNLFGTKNNNKLSVSFSDDDSVVDYEIYIAKKDEDFPASASYTAQPGKTSASLNYLLPGEEGVYKAKIVVRDFIRSDANTDSANPTGKKETPVFYFAVDSGAPVLSVTNPQDGAFVSRENGIPNGVSGTVSKRSGTKITGFIYENGDSSKKHLVELEDVTIEENASNEVYAWTGKVPKMPESGESFKFEITAIDAYEQTSVVTRTLGIDESAPTIKLDSDSKITDSSRIINESNPKYSVENGQKRYLVIGSWCDEYKNDYGQTVQGTGTNQLFYAYATENDSDGQPKWGEIYTVSGTAKSSATTTFNIYIPLAECSSFAYKVWGNDVAGNLKDANEADGTLVKNLVVDLAPPTLNLNGSFPDYVKSGNSLSLSGTYGDSYGVDSFKVVAKLNGSEVASGSKGYTFTDTRDADGKSGSFTIKVNPTGTESEGSWTFDISVTDKAGRTTSLGSQQTVVDTIAPDWNADSLKVNNVAYSYSEGAPTWYKSPVMPFSGTINESGSGIEVVKYSVIKAENATSSPSYGQSFFTTKQAGGTETFSSNLGEFNTVLSGNDVIPSTVYLKAVDKAGNESAAKEFKIYIDTASPEVECELNGTMTSNGKKAIDVKGSVSDDASGISSLKLQVIKSDGKTVATTIDAEINSGKWNASIDSLSDDSGYTVKALAEDKAGNSISSSLFKIKIDSQAPTFKFADGIESPVFTKDSLYTVKGSISDGTASSGIKGLYYSLSEQTVGADGCYDISGSGWKEGSVRSTGSAGSYSWSAEIDLSGISSTDGTAASTVYFAVCDEAGNVSLVSENNDSNSLKIARDIIAPVTTPVGSGLKKPASSLSGEESGEKDEAGNLTLAADSALDENITYYATGTYSLSGNVTEASGNYTVTVNGSKLTPENGKWTQAGKESDGSHSYTIVVTDKAGNSVSKKISVIRDATAPSLTVTNETTDKAALIDNKLITEENKNYSEEAGKHYYTLSGKWSDATTGTSRLQYRVRPYYDSANSKYVDSYSDWRDISDVTQSTAQSSWSAKIELTEGNGLGNGIWMQGRAIDAAGNIKKTDEFKGIVIDLGKPTVSEEGSLPAYVKNDEKLTLSGTYGDSYGVESCKVVAKLNGSEVSSGNKGYTFTDTQASDKKSGSFTIKVEPTGTESEGKWTFDVTVTDKAGRSSSLSTLSTTVDTVKPEWGTSFLVNKKEYVSGNWYNAAALPFSGSITESGSGVKEVRYSVIQAGASEGPTYSDSFVTTKGTGANAGKETFSANLGEFITKLSGSTALANKVYMKAVDNAGNESEEQVFDIYVDSESPTLQCDQSGTQVTNGTKDITSSGSFDDDASGVDSVTLEVSYTDSGSKKIVDLGTASAELNTGAKTWTFEIPASKLTVDATYSVKATVTDKAGNKSSSTLFNIQKDTTAPVFKTPALETTSEKYSVYKPVSGEETYYVNNTDGRFTISGVATDNFGVEKVELSISGKDASGAAKTHTDTASSGIYSFENIDFTGWSGEAVASLTVTDTAGNKNTSPLTLTIKFDSKAPKGLHALDGKNKDVYFRVGDYDNDDITSGDQLWNAALDKSVGGKYSEGTYGNTQTIKIRGNFLDSDSGVKMIYYKVYSSAPSDSELDAFLSDYSSLGDGYFAPLAASKTESRRVFYSAIDGASGGTIGDVSNGDNDAYAQTKVESSDSVTSASDGKTKYYAEITSNYDAVLSGLSIGNNYIVLVAVDNVGNAALDGVTVKNADGSTEAYTTYKNISLNVDNEAPTAEGKSESKYTNGSGEIELTGSATDNAAGIKSLVLSIKNNGEKTIEESENGTYGSLEITKDGSNATWKAKIKANQVFGDTNSNPKTGTFTVYALVKDRAGNSQTASVGTIVVDKNPPTVALKTPADADTGKAGIQVNGKISLSGTVSDANSLPDDAKIKIQYKKPDDSEWNDFTDVIVSGSAYSFTVSDINTAALDDNTSYQFRASAVDIAGNTGYSEPLSLEVNQDTDRPKVNITNLEYSTTLQKYLLKHGTNAQITGTIIDDDSNGTAVVKTLVISNSDYTGSESISGDCIFNKGSGSFTFTPSTVIDGEKTIYIYIEDNEGGIFYTSATVENNLKNPKLLLKENALAEDVNKAAFTYLSDSMNPALTAGSFFFYNNSKTIEKDSDGNDVNPAIASSLFVGGSKKKYVKFHFEGSDASGIAGMSFALTSANGTSRGKYATAVKIGDTSLTDYTVRDSQEFTSTNNADTVAVWTTDFIDVSSIPSGLITVTATIYDKIGLTSTNTYSFTVDNTAPAITVSEPVSGSVKTGKIEIKGNSSDGTGVGADSIKWFIPTASEANLSGDDIKSKVKAYFDASTLEELNTTDSASSWTFVFDGDDSESGSDQKFKNYDKEDYAIPVNGIYKLPVYFLAEDALGNYSVKTDYFISHDPDGDKPVVTFSYPTVDNYETGNSYITLGGEISVTGTATILNPPNGVTLKDIYYQIAEENADFKDAKNYAQEKYSGRTDVEILTAEQVIKAMDETPPKDENDTAVLKNFGFSSYAEYQTWWGIKPEASLGMASTSSIWNFALNSKGELNPASASGTNNIKIRACGVNSAGKFGAWSASSSKTSSDKISIHIDNAAPTISAVINQYGEIVTDANAKTLVATASQSYTPDMYLRGKWYLVLTLLDESGIKDGNFVTNASESGVKIPCYIDSDGNESESSEGAKKKGYKVYFPIQETDGSVSYTVKTEDTDEGEKHTATQTFSFNIDNIAPSLSVMNSSDEELKDTGNEIQNSDYIYTIKGNSLDEGAGVEHVVFYYIRDTSTKTGIENPLLLDPLVTADSSKSDIYAGARISLSLSDVEAVEVGSGKPLYARKITGKTDTVDTFTASEEYDAHVRKGGLVKIGGLIRKITNVTGATITFSPALTEKLSGDSVEAFFVMAQVIDANNTQKQNSNKENPFSFDSGKDDGDGMPESFTKSGSNWSWDASIHSDNMPDGPVTLVILAFDKAGNVSSASYNAMVMNNVPKLAKVFLATDLNRNDNYDDDEFETYNIAADGHDGAAVNQKTFVLKTEGFSKYTYDEKSKEWNKNESSRRAFTIKKGLAVVPEIVGGNGAMKLVFNSNDGTEGTDGRTGTGESVLAVSDTVSYSSFKGWNLSSITDAVKDAATQTMSFTFWDSTEECTPGSDSQYAFLKVTDFVIDQVDDIAPNVVVDPFYWKSLTENSIYGSGSAKNVAALQGHIELESDLTDAIKTSLGDDPKVSGKIVIRGSAYDETLLNKLSFSMTNFKSSTETPLSMAEYTTTTGTDGKKTSAWSVSSNTMAANSYEVTVEEEYMNQDGHKVNWTVALDTEALSDVAHKDAEFTVIANDQKNSSASRTGSADGTTDATKHKPSYQMDVVPYITGITNRVGNAQKKDGSIFGRSATGAYPVYYDNSKGGEEFTVEGFNFGERPQFNVGGTGKQVEGTSITVTSDMTSGELIAWVWSDSNNVYVGSLNNMNNNDAKGDYDAGSTSGYDKYKNYYNRQPNNINNSTLTDDCKVSVWNVTQVVSDSAVRYPTMRVGKDRNETIAFVYDSSSDAVKAYKSATVTARNGFNLGTSYTQWYDTAVAVDSSGNLYGSSMNGDTGGSGNALYAGLNANNLFFARNTSAEQSTWAYSSSDYGYAIESGYYGKVTGTYTGGNGWNSYTYNTYDGQFYSNRVVNPKIATDSNNKVYMVYYDYAAGQVKFRYDSALGSHEASDLVYNQNNTRRWNGGKASADGYHVIAGATDIYNVSAVKTANASRAGEYSAVGASSDGAAIVVWYSEDDHGLFYTYNKTPSNSTTWSDAVPIDDGFVGWYVDLVVDGSNGVHIAYYDAGNGDLKYAYVQDYTKPAEKKVMTVDSYLSSGTNISISVKKVGSDYVPYISSFMSSFNKTSYTVRTAWITDGSLLKTKTAEELQGVKDDDFTGVWEVMTVPLAQTSIPLDYSVGIGIKNDQPILGYGTQNGLETATLR